MKSQLIGFRRICSFKEVVEIATRTLFKILRLRGYALSLFRSIEADVRQTFGHPEFNMTGNEGKQFNPFVNTYSPSHLNTTNKRTNFPVCVCVNLQR